MHGEHIKLVVASIAFSNVGIGCDHTNIALDVGAPLPVDPVAAVLAANKPTYDDEWYDAWGDAVAKRQIELSRRAIELARELDATMRSYTTLDHADFDPCGSGQGGLFGPDGTRCEASVPTASKFGRMRLPLAPISTVS